MEISMNLSGLRAENILSEGTGVYPPGLENEI
jgi:hypothetical protein